MAGTPHVPTGDGAIGTPAFAEGEEIFGLGLVFFAVGDGPAFLYAEVVDRENVGAAEAKDQKHFNRPGADAADGGEALDELFVRDLLRFFERRHDAFDSLLGEVFHGQDFCAGEAGFAKSGFAELENFLRRRDAASRTEGFDAGEDGGGGFAGNGLVGDGFEKGFVGGVDAVGGQIHLEWRSFFDEEFQFFIVGQEMFDGFLEIKRGI